MSLWITLQHEQSVYHIWTFCVISYSSYKLSWQTCKLILWLFASFLCVELPEFIITTKLENGLAIRSPVIVHFVHELYEVLYAWWARPHNNGRSEIMSVEAYRSVHVQ